MLDHLIFLLAFGSLRHSVIQMRSLAYELEARKAQRFSLTLALYVRKNVIGVLWLNIYSDIFNKTRRKNNNFAFCLFVITGSISMIQLSWHCLITSL